MKFLALAILLYCCQLAAGVSGGADISQPFGMPFRFEPSSDQLPKQHYKILKGAVAKNESHKIFWPVSKPSIPDSHVSNTYTEISFPNPFLDASKCVRFAGVSHTWICDPDMILDPDQQAYVESRLIAIRDKTAHICTDGQKYNFQLAVAIATNISPYGDEDPQHAAERMANRMLRQWGIGNKNCHDGLLLLFITDRNVAILAAREGVERKYISETTRQYVQQQMTTWYALTRDPNAAILKGISLIESRLPVVAGGATTGMGWVGSIILLVLIVYVISVLLAYVFFDYILTKNYLEMLG